MNEVFNFKRFGTYFLYDLRQMWRKHSRPAFLIGCSIAILYVIWVLFSLIFTQSWNAPGVEVRSTLLLVAFTILELYQARTYGYLTDPREGAEWLMVPASRAEKFVSMILMTLFVIPVLFLVVFFTLDGLFALVDPTYGKALIVGFWEAYRKIFDMASISGQSPVTFSTGALVYLSVVGFFCNYLYFLLCGICFKRNKIVIAIAIIFAFSTLLSVGSGLAIPILAVRHPMNVDALQIARLTAGLLNGTEVFCCLLAIGLGWGIWRRIKTLQH